MFGILDDIADVAISVAAKASSVATLGLLDEKSANRLLASGWSIYKISQEYGISQEDVRKLLK